jgi:hypothetical protein
VSCQRFKLVADVYVVGDEGVLSEEEVASLVSRTLPYGRTLRLIIDPQQVGADHTYRGEPAPLLAELFGGRSHG